MKKFLSILSVLVMTSTLLAGCGNNSGGGGNDGEMYISVVSKGFQHQFWQAVKAGSDQAAIDLGVTVYFDGPEGESAIGDQVNMINAELAKNPAAMALAALDTQAVLSQLADAKSRNIPIIGFDSGVPDAPAGQIAANASTNNDAAAALGAEKMFPAISDKISAATSDNPVVIVVLSQDVTSASIQGRTRGFAVEMAKLAKGVNSSVAIVGGYSAINEGDAGAAVRIEVIVGATPDITDMTNAANGALLTPNLIGIFCSNEGAVNGLLAAINAGSKVPDDVKLVGFDAGSGQKAAIKAGILMGSITQDPFQIGYKAVELAVKAAKGESVSDVDTGAKWYDASNIDQPDIAILVYD
ncbi:MAG: ABC transporter substrate-binding protein [Lachnospiraceae bacterium]|nr:ABC transporter substrate-binding protein [Lachnospiraceae bacterium]